jgi:hypothetical protein
MKNQSTLLKNRFLLESSVITDPSPLCHKTKRWDEGISSENSTILGAL